MSKTMILALAAIALLGAAGCGNQNGASSIPTGMQATPAMSQAQIDAQNAKHNAFMAMKKAQ